MSEQKINCYILPSKPSPLLLPVECVAEVVAQPVIEKMDSAPLCYGDVKQIAVIPDMGFGEVPQGSDRRYIESVITIGEQDFIVPKLTALGVAFSYF